MNEKLKSQILLLMLLKYNEMKKIVAYVFILFSISGFSQEILSLEDCYQLVNTNYPLVKQNAMLEKQHNIDLDAITTKKLPQINLSAQATYQSDVIEIPIPNSGIEALNNDQYRATLSVNQLIYEGGLINASLKAKDAALKTKQKQVEVNVYQLKKQVNQLYFSVLLTQEKKALLRSKKEQLDSKLKEVNSGIKNGVLLPASNKVLEAELLKINQQLIEIDLNKISLIHTLSSLIGKDISVTTYFENPKINFQSNNSINRPELELFQLKKSEIETSEQLLIKQNSPKLIGFASSGYGNPGLNMLDNSFQTFYTIGIKLNWNIFDWNANNKKREALAINKDIIDNEREIFELNTTIELQQQLIEIEKLSKFIESDMDIIQLRKEVLKSVESQLRNGVITSSGYVTELTNLYEDENNLRTHKIQQLLAKANYNITKGQ